MALITRNEIAKTKRIIGCELAKIQRAFHDEEALQSYKDDNEEELYWEQFDFLENAGFNYETCNKIIGLIHSDINTFTDELANKLKKLFRVIGTNEFYIIAHLKLDFFGNRNNNFKPLVNSYKKLEKIVGQNSYKEGFKIGENEISDFVEILFWLTRCDPGVPEYIFLFDESEKIQINICKYGNIHLTEFGDEQLTEKTLASLGWTLIQGQESDSFTNPF